MTSFSPRLRFVFQHLYLVSQLSWCSRKYSRSSSGPVKTGDRRRRARATEAHGLSCPKGHARLPNVVQVRRQTKGDPQALHQRTSMYDSVLTRFYPSSVPNGFSHYTAKETSTQPWTHSHRLRNSITASCQEANLDVANTPDSANKIPTAMMSFKQPAIMASKRALS